MPTNVFAGLRMPCRRARLLHLSLGMNTRTRIAQTSARLRRAVLSAEPHTPGECIRCHGLEVIVRLYDYADSCLAWRCIICGQYTFPGQSRREAHIQTLDGLNVKIGGTD